MDEPVGAHDDVPAVEALHPPEVDAGRADGMDRHLRRHRGPAPPACLEPAGEQHDRSDVALDADEEEQPVLRDEGESHRQAIRVLHVGHEVDNVGEHVWRVGQEDQKACQSRPPRDAGPPAVAEEHDREQQRHEREGEVPGHPEPVGAQGGPDQRQKRPHGPRV